MNKIHKQFGAAVLAAPLFVLLHNTIFQQQLLDLQLVSFDMRSLLFLIIFYPVVEELAFRGVIQEYIAAKTKEYPSFFYLSIANIVTSLLFVAMHFVHHTPLWAMLVFIPSLVFGYFKEQYGHIGASIFLHMFYNACSLFLIL
ncbi:JDVT-CTERM system glutamic-type intramembrane protease [Sulfurovum sp. XTW-4]|uniref:JDVT-CTERM system glutamic-type intramembrane protease n=1 Tax=Sulfurovum xiamenensis TaxID=3019066 RepID=A0ABT7QQB9_9BACT|nr:JDVT-CTERM system glutamic-type intramembrane protease [Sulfurovum xiamenensis]MDM5263292.1 JDVT-CTERM system glutamic-type intramembrane protease [Sulfurovum xiamenensis]